MRNRSARSSMRSEEPRRPPLRVRAAHEEMLAIAREIQSLTARKADAERRADYLRHLVAEIDEAQLKSGEDVDTRGRSAASRACGRAASRSLAEWRASSRVRRARCSRASGTCSGRSRRFSALMPRSRVCRSCTTAHSIRSQELARELDEYGAERRSRSRRGSAKCSGGAT